MGETEFQFEIYNSKNRYEEKKLEIKWYKSREFSKEERQMAEKHLEICSTYLYVQAE